MVITRGLRGGKMGGYCLIETKFEFWWWKEFCSWMMMMVAQPCECASAQLSRSVVSDSLWPHELQHFRPPSPSPTPRVYPNSCPLSWWCHPTVSPSVIPFSSCLQSFPTSGSFLMSQIFAAGGQKLEFQLQHQSFNEYPGPISFSMDWVDLLAV